MNVFAENTSSTIVDVKDEDVAGNTGASKAASFASVIFRVSH